MTETGNAGGATAARRVTRGPGPSGRGRSSRNPVSRASLYTRESYAELRKAVWPTRTELFTYTAVVVVFVSFIIGLVYGLDVGFAKAVFEIFG